MRRLPAPSICGEKQPHSRLALMRALIAFSTLCPSHSDSSQPRRGPNYPIIWIDLIFLLQINAPNTRYVTLHRKNAACDLIEMSRQLHRQNTRLSGCFDGDANQADEHRLLRHSA